MLQVIQCYPMFGSASQVQESQETNYTYIYIYIFIYLFMCVCMKPGWFTCRFASFWMRGCTIIEIFFLVKLVVSGSNMLCHRNSLVEFDPD